MVCTKEDIMELQEKIRKLEEEIIKDKMAVDSYKELERELDRLCQYQRTLEPFSKEKKIAEEVLLRKIEERDSCRAGSSAENLKRQIWDLRRKECRMYREFDEHQRKSNKAKPGGTEDGGPVRAPLDKRKTTGTLFPTTPKRKVFLSPVRAPARRAVDNDRLANLLRDIGTLQEKGAISYRKLHNKVLDCNFESGKAGAKARKVKLRGATEAGAPTLKTLNQDAAYFVESHAKMVESVDKLCDSLEMLKLFNIRIVPV